MISANEIYIKDRFVRSTFLIEDPRVAILGPNGAGKSTLLRILAGLEEHQGVVKTNESICYCGDSLALDNSMIVEDILSLSRGAKSPDQTMIHKLVDEFHITSLLNKSFSNLSGGEKQRVNLVAAFYYDCDTILLDEPTNYLDPIYKDILVNFLQSYNRRAIITSHDLNFLLETCYRFIGLKKGKLISNDIKLDFISNSVADVIFDKNFIYEKVCSRDYIL